MYRELKNKSTMNIYLVCCNLKHEKSWKLVVYSCVSKVSESSLDSVYLLAYFLTWREHLFMPLWRTVVFLSRCAPVFHILCFALSMKLKFHFMKNFKELFQHEVFTRSASSGTAPSSHSSHFLSPVATSGLR